MFEYLNYINAVRNCGSFTAAADKLCISQPALSLAIRKAEESLGVKLFDRNQKPVRLTEAGKLYLEAADRALLMENEMKEQLKAAEASVSGTIRIGAAGIAMNYLIPEILEAFRKQYPGVQTEITEESYYTLKELLRAEEIDLIVDTELSDPDFTSTHLFQNTVLYAVPEILIDSDALRSKGFTAEEILSGVLENPSITRIRMQDVQHIPFLSLQPRNELYLRAELYFNNYGVRPETIMHLNQQMTAYRFAARGFGATFVGDTLVKYYPLQGLRFYLFDCPMPPRRIAASYKKNRYVTGAMRAFLDIAETIYREKAQQILQ